MLKCWRVLRSMDEGTYVEPSKETLGAFIFRWSTDYALACDGGKFWRNDGRTSISKPRVSTRSPSLEQTRKGGLKFKIPVIGSVGV